MERTLRPTLVLLLVFTVLLGVVYPSLVTGFARFAFPSKAAGSIITIDRQPVGSALIGQPFSRPEYFWGRPSATMPMPYNAAASNGSNLGPSNPALLEAVKARIAALHAADPGNALPIPVDLVTASGSGLDPHISPAAAYYQVARVARARGLAEVQVRYLVQEHVESRLPWLFGEARVNVLKLNLALKGLEEAARK